MEPTGVQKQFFSVWAIPPDEVRDRVKKLMEGLRSEFGGPQFEPHMTLVRSVALTKQDALNKFRSACDGLKAYSCAVDHVDSQYVSLALHPTPEVVEASAHCCGHFGYKRDTPYTPHLSLVYTDLTEENKIKAQEKINSLDESIKSLTFQINRLQLWATDPKDTSSWEKVADYTLQSYELILSLFLFLCYNKTCRVPLYLARFRLFHAHLISMCSLWGY